MSESVTIRYLEMTSRDELRPARATSEPLQVVRSEVALPEWNRFFYVAVGRDWKWCDRLAWTREAWLAWVDRPQLETWIGYVRGTPVGYFELERQLQAQVEIAYFGLLPAFTGRGLGGALLTQAVERAWAEGTQRVWLHTCSLDHPAAMQNYLARGFRQFREETKATSVAVRNSRAWYE